VSPLASLPNSKELSLDSSVQSSFELIFTLPFAIKFALLTAFSITFDTSSLVGTSLVLDDVEVEGKVELLVLVLGFVEVETLVGDPEDDMDPLLLILDLVESLVLMDGSREPEFTELSLVHANKENAKNNTKKEQLFRFIIISSFVF